MSNTFVLCMCILVVNVFISSVSQVMLKKSAQKQYESAIKEYLNPLVICAYVLFVGTTILGVIAYRGIPLSMGPIFESTSYIYVTIFGVKIFGEKINARKICALALILIGIVIYSVWG